MIDAFQCRIDYDNERGEIEREISIEKNIMTLVYSQILRIYISSDTFS